MRAIDNIRLRVIDILVRSQAILRFMNLPDTEG